MTKGINICQTEFLNLLYKTEVNMLDYNVKIGLVPLRRDCIPRPGMFNWEYAEKRGRETSKQIKAQK